LISFLERNLQVQNIYLSLDNDKAGKDATNRIVKELISSKEYSRMKIIIAAPPPIGKDYADVLQAIHKLNEKTKPDRSKEAVVSI